MDPKESNSNLEQDNSIFGQGYSMLSSAGNAVK